VSNIQTGNTYQNSYIGEEKDVESSLGDHGVRKYDYEIGRFTSVDPLWEKYTGWTGYQYSLNNPVNYLDNNGKWVKEISNEAHRHKGTISRNSNGYIANKINYEFYNKWTKTAPAIAEFVEKNNLFVMQKDLGGDLGQGELGGNLTEYDLTKKNAPEKLEGTALHEIVHNMGGNEFQSFSAQYAAGLMSKTDLIMYLGMPNYIFNGVTISFSDKYFKEGYGRIDKDDLEEAINDMKEYGLEIINKGFKK